ncbi:MAG: hypothetical protein ACYCSF_08680 [Acidimicrobiales bacterium]
MPEVVKMDERQLRSARERAEVLRGPLGPQRVTVLTAEDEVGVDVAGPESELLSALASAVGSESCDRVTVESNGPATALALRRDDEASPGGVRGRTARRDGARISGRQLGRNSFTLVPAVEWGPEASRHLRDQLRRRPRTT